MFNRPPRSASVLIVDEDTTAAQSLETLFQNAGLETRKAQNSEQWLAAIESFNLDAIVVKLSWQGSDVFQACRRAREVTSAPILLLGAQSDHRDVIQGLEAGADGHVPTPCSPELTLAYVRALLRRRRLDRMAADRVLQIRNLKLDLDRCEATLRGYRLTLTPTEFRLLWSLAANAGRVVSCGQLLEMAQGYRCADQEAQEIIKVHVGHLRSKLPVQAGESPYILTVRGFGYMLERRVGSRSAGSVSEMEDDAMQPDVEQQCDMSLRPFRRTRRGDTSTGNGKKPALPASAVY